MQNDERPRITRRTFVTRAAITLASLITAACGADNAVKRTPTPVQTPPPLEPPFPVPPTPPPPTPNTLAQVLYVDTLDARASDANPGTADRPLKTIGKAAAMALDPALGSKSAWVMIAPGVYRESVALQPNDARAAASITFQAKENGTAIIAGSDVWTGWRTQGTTNIYTHTWPYKWGMAPYPAGWQGNVDLKPIVRHREMIFINGDPVTQVLSLADLKEGTFFVAEQSSTVTLVPPAGVQIENATVEVATRSGIFSVDGAQNLTVRGLVFMHDNTPVGGTAVTFTNCANTVVEDCKFLWNNWAGMTFQSAAPHISQSMTARRNIANNNGGIGLAAARIKDILYEDNETSYNNWRGARGEFYLWSNAGMKHLFIHGGIYRRHRAVGNQAPGCWFDTDCANIEIDQAFFCRNNGPGLFIEASQGPTYVKGCIICDNQSEAGIYTHGGSDVTLESNILYGNAETQIRAVKGVRPVKDWETNEALALIAERWTMRKNVIVGTDALPHLANIANGSGFFSTFVSDENIWFSPKKSGAFVVDEKSMDFSKWQSVSHHDANSQFIDPLFVSPENDDFRLRDTSPLQGR